MSLLTDIFSNKHVQFAEAMADKITRQFPPSSEPQLIKKGAQRRLEGILEIIISDLDKYHAEVSLGWIGKARLGNAFRWKLRERGYSHQFVEALTEGIILHIATK